MSSLSNVSILGIRTTLKLWCAASCALLDFRTPCPRPRPRPLPLRPRPLPPCPRPLPLRHHPQLVVIYCTANLSPSSLLILVLVLQPSNLVLVLQSIHRPTPPTTALAMGGKKRLRLCQCSLCIQLTHKGRDDVERPGQMMELRKWKTHQTDEAIRAADEDYLLHQTLVASVIDTAREPSLATRPRDLELPADVGTKVRAQDLSSE